MRITERQKASEHVGTRLNAERDAMQYCAGNRPHTGGVGDSACDVDCLCDSIHPEKSNMLNQCYGRYVTRTK